MLHALESLNWFAVIISIIVYFGLGGIWFTLVVNRAYVAALGREPMTGAVHLVGPLLCLTVQTITSATLIGALGVTSFAGAIAFGGLIGIGYLLPMTVNIALNPLFPRPFLYSLINAPFFIMGSVLISLILVAMG